MRPIKFRLSAVEFAAAVNHLRLTPATVAIIKAMTVQGLTHREALQGQSEVISESAASRAIRKIREFSEMEKCSTCGSLDGPGHPIHLDYKIDGDERLRMTASQFNLAMKQKELHFSRATQEVIKPMVTKGATFKAASEGLDETISESAASRAIRKLRLFCESPRCPDCGAVLIAPALKIPVQKPTSKAKKK